MEAASEVEEILTACFGHSDVAGLPSAVIEAGKLKLASAMANETDEARKYLIWVAWQHVGSAPDPREVLTDMRLIARADGLMTARKFADIAKYKIVD